MPLDAVFQRREAAKDRHLPKKMLRVTWDQVVWPNRHACGVCTCFCRKVLSSVSQNVCCGAGKMAQRERHLLASKPDDLNLTPAVPMAEGKN